MKTERSKQHEAEMVEYRKTLSPEKRERIRRELAELRGETPPNAKSSGTPSETVADADKFDVTRWREEEVSRKVRAKILAHMRSKRREADANRNNQDELDDAVAEDIFRSTRGYRGQKISQEGDAVPSVDQEPMGGTGMSDDALADEIFAASRGNTDHDLSVSMENDQNPEDDEDSRLADDIFASCGGGQI